MSLESQVIDHLGWEKLPPSNRAKLSSQALKDLATFPSDWPENEMAIGALAFPGTPGVNYGIILGIFGLTLSRGNVTIVSADTNDLPLVNLNYLSSKTDQEVAVQMFRRLRALLNSPSFAPVRVGQEVFPGSAVQTDEEILEQLKESIGPAYHASCTCKSFAPFGSTEFRRKLIFSHGTGAMGKSSDPNAVVDSHARVIGVRGLRVVDASSFPILPPGHPSGTICKTTSSPKNPKIFSLTEFNPLM